jgi:hypothetical protein
METALRQFVMARARGRCEYCQFPEAFSYLPFQVDHIIAQQHRGPTTESWDDHFAWHGALLLPKSDIGQVTIEVLQMNHPDVVELREWLLEFGLAGE